MARIATCICPNCNRLGVHPVNVNNRGKNNGFLCDLHFDGEESYYTENSTRRGKKKVNGFTYSMEFETNSSTKKGRIELLNLGFIPTSDSTVDVEYKSPIYEGLNAISKQVLSIDVLIENNDISVQDSTYNTTGTHFHVGHTDHINPKTMDYIRRFYHSIFLPLSERMKSNPEETAAFWGRNFTYYASPIDNYTSATAHENFINLQHDYTIEFRLAKFVNAKQYMNVVKFTKDVATTIINNFIVHFNNEDYNPAKFANKTEYRKHQAAKTGKKIIMLYDKYTANI